MAKSISIFRGTTGLNDKIDPARLRFDPETGVQDLAEAVNIDIDSSGRPSRRKGYSQLRSEAVHSLWSNGDVCYYVSGTALYQLNLDWTRTGLRSGLTTGAPMSFCNPDGGTKTYYCNGFENGVISSGVSSAWIGSPYVGPVTIWKISTIPPVGHLLESIGGYMLIAEDDVLWHSVQFAHSWYRPSRDRFQFDGRISMIKALDDGLWVSDAKATYWLEGLDPMQWKRNLKADYPALFGSAAYFDGALLGEGNLYGRCVVWTTPKNGICIGGPQGYFANLTQRKLVYPACDRRGAGLVIGDRYVCAME